MPRRTSRRGRTRGRSIRRRRPTRRVRSGRGRVGGLGKRLAKLEATQGEAKHIVFTDTSVPAARVSPWMSNRNIYFGTSYYGSDCLNAYPIRGTSSQQRIGDKIVTTKFQAKINVVFGAQVVDKAYVEWALVCVKDHRGAYFSDPGAATNGYWVRRYGTASGQVPTEQALPNINNKSTGLTYRVLKKGRVDVYNPLDSTAENRIINIMWMGRLESDHSLGNTGTYTDVDKNGMYLYIWTNSPIINGLGVNGVTINGEAHLYFRD